MKVDIYLHSANDERFKNVLIKFATGINLTESIEIVGKEISKNKGDVAVIFGSYKPYNLVPHHKYKKEILKNYKNYIQIETPLIGRKEVKVIGEDNWFRVGVNGFLNHQGEFNNKNKPSDRWEIIKKELNIRLTSWNYEGKNITVVLQNPGDASLLGTDISRWAYETIIELRKWTDKTIILRTPQLDKLAKLNRNGFISKALKVYDVQLQIGTKNNLLSTLYSTWCSVVFTSGFAIDSIIQGIPCIVMNRGNFASDISSETLSDIENPKRVNRQSWLNNLSYCQWSIEEMEKGLPWQHLKPVI